jgi:hypothetical protein
VHHGPAIIAAGMRSAPARSTTITAAVETAMDNQRLV